MQSQLRRHQITIMLAAAGAMIIVGVLAIWLLGVGMNRHTFYEGVITKGSLERWVTVSELASKAPVVVRGRPGGVWTLIIEADPDPRQGSKTAYRVLAVAEFAVIEYLKGAGPNTISLIYMEPTRQLDRVHAEEVDAPQLASTLRSALDERAEYVLFPEAFDERLDVPASLDRRSSFMLLSDQRRWLVEGQKVTRVYGESVSEDIDHIRDLAQRSTSTDSDADVPP